MINHQTQLRKLPRHHSRMPQMTVVKEQVIRHTKPLQHPKAAQKFRTNHKILVRLVLNNVPHSHKTRRLQKFLQLPLATRCTQIHPAHHTSDKGILLRQTKGPASLLGIVLSLHKHCPIHPRSAQMRLQIHRQIVPANPPMTLLPQPTIFKR